MWARRTFTILLALGLMIGLGPTLGITGASAAPGQDTRDLERQLGVGVEVAIHDETGMVRFIGTAPGRPIPKVADTESPEAAARAFLAHYGPAFGVADQRAELRRTRAERATRGRSVVRFQQRLGGVPVLGGELAVNLDRDGNILSVSGEVLPSEAVATEPSITREAARGEAIDAVAKSREVAPGALAATDPELWIYDSRILGGPGLDIPTLAWRMDVGDGSLIDELVLVDARRGNVILTIDQIETAKYRVVCDANNTSTKFPCTSGYARVEGQAATGNADVDDAYDFSGDTYDFYSTILGRDSIDGAGMNLVSTVRWCPDGIDCPYENAFWSGTQMVYGDGYASADDVVGHELTHGVTEHESRLFYYYQSGAINESFSDIFGEFVDLTNGAGNDGPGVRWLLGEDLPIGAIRSMSNPPAFGDPDRMTSPYYQADPNEWDAGGVHWNSGVGNKAAYLMTDGGSFNGRTVTGMGITKVALIFYEVNANLLTSAGDYADLGTALPQACTNLIGTAGITAADCTEVSDAVAAVEMHVVPPAAPNPEAPVCPAGSTPTTLWLDDLENPASGNWSKQSGWYYPQNPNPYWDMTYATSGVTNFFGDDLHYVTDIAIWLNAGVPIPSGKAVYLRFNHAFGFEDGSYPYDGGVLEYRTATSGWTDARSLFTHGGYNGTIYAGFGNPLGGRKGFVRESNGYISSRLALSSLAGETVRIRFRIGTDSSMWDYGWFVDDVEFYECSMLPGPTIGLKAKPKKVAWGKKVKLIAQAPPCGEGPDRMFLYRGRKKLLSTYASAGRAVFRVRMKKTAKFRVLMPTMYAHAHYGGTSRWVTVRVIR